jgi:hypothetical protein
MKSDQFKIMCMDYCKSNQSVILTILKDHNNFILQYINLAEDPNDYFEKEFTKKDNWRRGVKRTRPDGTILRMFQTGTQIHFAFITDKDDNNILYRSEPGYGYVSFSSVGSGFDEEVIKPYYDIKL